MRCGPTRRLAITISGSFVDSRPREHATATTPASKCSRRRRQNNLRDARQSLRQGLAERAVGLQGVGQGDLFVDQAAGGHGEPAIEIRKYEPLSGPLREYIEALWREQPDDELSLELALRAGVEDATNNASLRPAFEPGLTPERRVQLLRLLREFGDPRRWAATRGSSFWRMSQSRFVLPHSMSWLVTATARSRKCCCPGMRS